MRTKHFKIDTGRVDLIEFYQMLIRLAEKWEANEVSKIRFFKAGFVDVYLSITAARWYHWSVCNDPDWSGDAEDVLADGLFKYMYRSLEAKPRPEKVWKGNWFEFNSPAELREHAEKHIENLRRRHEQRNQSNPQT